MAKRRRAPGGGRKPKGRFSRLTSPLSLRMPADMRKELQAAAHKSGKSITQEVLHRLQDSFHRDWDGSRDPGLRAVCFLIREIAEGVSISGMWRSNPFLFMAFKLAVARLLDALEPPGEIQSPVDMDGMKGFMLKNYESPEALANYVVSIVWSELHRTAPLGEEMKYEEMMREFPEDRRMRDRRFYGMPDARRDLQVNLQYEKP